MEQSMLPTPHPAFGHLLPQGEKANTLRLPLPKNAVPQALPIVEIRHAR